MSMKDDVTKALIKLHERTGKEWIDLKSIYNEVEKNRGVPNVNEGASIRRILETYTKGFDYFQGEELYESYGKGTGLYKSMAYDRYKFIKNINIGDIFTREQLMNIFKISGQSGMMKSNTLNCLVLTTSEYNGIYEDGGIQNGTIMYTGEGQVGNQSITKNNKTLYFSNDNDVTVYLFSKDKQRRYTFEGQVKLYDKPYQVSEKDINGNDRLVWKFPLRVVYEESDDEDNDVKELSFEIKKIEEKHFIEKEEKNKKIEYIPGVLNIRKYRKTDKTIQRKSKPDYIAQEIVKNHQGIVNEKYVFELEIQRMYEEEATELVKVMEEFFENKRENEGFDILSFEKNEQGEYVKKYIEVKSTKGGEETPIDITADEIEFAKKHIDNYYLYRVIYSDSDKRSYKIVKGKDLLDLYNFVPINYKIYSK